MILKWNIVLEEKSLSFSCSFWDVLAYFLCLVTMWIMNML